jgi:hypothetical protein
MKTKRRLLCGERGGRRGSHAIKKWSDERKEEKEGEIMKWKYKKKRKFG